MNSTPVCLRGRQDRTCNATEKSHLGSNPSTGSFKYQQYLSYIERWLNGAESGMRGKTNISSHIRRWLLQQRGELCWRCSWNEKHPNSGKCPLEVDHIDGCHTNNHPSNLQLLCPNCHALTPTYKNRNKGNGRHVRKTRYKEGKSY